MGWRFLSAAQDDECRIRRTGSSWGARWRWVDGCSILAMLGQESYSADGAAQKSVHLPPYSQSPGEDQLDSISIGVRTVCEWLVLGSPDLARVGVGLALEGCLGL